jgi:hypothetical protein
MARLPVTMLSGKVARKAEGDLEQHGCDFADGVRLGNGFHGFDPRGGALFP